LEHLNTAVLSLIKKNSEILSEMLFFFPIISFSVFRPANKLSSEVSTLEEQACRREERGETTVGEIRNCENSKSKKQKKNWKQPVQKTSAMRSFVISPPIPSLPYTGLYGIFPPKQWSE
jgi:hypothetical protein